MTETKKRGCNASFLFMVLRKLVISINAFFYILQVVFGFLEFIHLTLQIQTICFIATLPFTTERSICQLQFQLFLC